MNQILAWFYWNPSPTAWVIPWVDHPIRWYGLCFVVGFFVAFQLAIKMFHRLLKEQAPALASKELALEMGERLMWVTVVGTIVGARLGYVFFYGWPKYQADPWTIFRIWEGGLASHGGAIGVLIALAYFTRLSKRNLPWFTYQTLLDIVAVPTAFVAFCIRVGNFINQEIVGYPTNLPWAVLFAHPADRSAAVPRHAVQLYEGFGYLAIFCVLLYLWQKHGSYISKGLLSSIFFIGVFSLRILMEFLKLPQSLHLNNDTAILKMGQILSIPFLLFGLFLLYRSLRLRVSQN
jgi:phosphatidylglycerol:prolipoprotein diacylglycerol transferase